jgi:hypothetical protein
MAPLQNHHIHNSPNWLTVQHSSCLAYPGHGTRLQEQAPKYASGVHMCCVHLHQLRFRDAILSIELNQGPTSLRTREENQEFGGRVGQKGVPRNTSGSHVLNNDNSLDRLFFMDLFDAQVGDGLCALAKYQHNCSGHATTRRCFQVNRQIGLGNSSCTRGLVDEKFEDLTRRLAPHAVCLHASFYLLFLFLYLPAVSAAAAAAAAPAPVLAARGERASVIVTSISRDTTSFHVLLLESSTHYQVLRGYNSPCVQRTCSTQRRQFSFGRHRLGCPQCTSF